MSVIINHVAELPINLRTARFKDRDRSLYKLGKFYIKSRYVY